MTESGDLRRCSGPFASVLRTALLVTIAALAGAAAAPQRGRAPAMQPQGRAQGPRSGAPPRAPWWRSPATIGLYGALAGVVATLIGTNLTTAQAERTFFAEQRAEAYAEFINACSDALTEFDTVGSPSVESARRIERAQTRILLVGSEQAQAEALAVSPPFVGDALPAGSDPFLKAVRDAARSNLRSSMDAFIVEARADLAPGG